MSRLCIVLLAVLFVISAGCGHSGTSSGAEATAPEPPVVMAVTGAKVTTAPMSRQLRLLGTTVAMRHVTLRAPTAGRLIGFDLQAGMVVHRGEVLGRIINREIQAAQNGLAVAQVLEPKQARALAEALKRNSANASVAVVTPDNAIVSQRLVSSGQLVAELDPLADLIDPKSIYVEAQAPIQDVALVRAGMPAVITSQLDPGVEFPGKVDALIPSVTTGGVTTPVRITFTGNRQITVSGAPAEVTITTASFPQTVVVPTTALFDDAATQQHYVFLEGSDGQAHRRVVTTGIQENGLTQILTGLFPGEVVITSGGYALSNGLHVQVTLANG